MATDDTTLVSDDTGATGTTDTTATDTTQTDTTTVTATDTGATTDTSATTTTTDTATDWRSEWAGDDAEVAKFLGRYQSAAAAIKAFKQQHGDLRSGKYLKPVDENSTDEEKAAWAKALGVPDKPEGYLEKLPEGLVIGDDDKPAVNAFLAKMHESGAPKGVADAALQAYYGIVEEQAAATSEANENARRAGEDALREEWGADYRRNLNVVKGFAGQLPEGVADALMGGTAPDGIRLANKPEVIKWLAGLALEANPLATVVPGAGSNQASAIGEELDALKAKMGDRNSDYWKGPTAAKQQARYRELVEAQQKIK